MAKTCMIYITGGAEEIRALAKAAVEERLAACANILGTIQSVYRWEGSVCEAEETALILKTTTGLRDKLIERMTDLHSYECPCVVSWTIEAGNRTFLEWIEGETASS